MSPDSHHTAETVQRASSVVDAVIEANKSDDPLQVAFEVIGAATLIVGSDAQARTSLAWFLRRYALKLDSDVIDAPTLQ